jgi:streptogramin lyase
MRRWLSALATVACLALAGPAAAAPVVTEFPLPSANAVPQDIVLGPDGKLWFTENAMAVNKIGRVTPGDPPLIEEFDVPANFSQPLNITVGPDNRIWFSGTFNGAGGVGRMNPANPADTQGFGGFGVTSPRGIAAGADGSIWLGDAAAGTVVRIDPASGAEQAVSDIPINAGSFNIRNLAPGPDGNVWVTDFGGQIARVTSAGVANAFDVTGNAAWDILAGPDGNLWYTVPDGNRVGKITTAGTFSDFPVTAGGDQFGITVGPDGALWFAQAVANDIGRMSTDGQFSEVGGLTAGARPEYIAAGPANTLWFTEKDGNRIGRITGIEVGGQGPPPPPPPADTTRPDVTRFRITRKVFRVGGLGTVIKWTLSEDATVTIRFARRVGRRFRRVRRVMRFQSSAGALSLRFRGRFDLKHPLRPGRYRMTMTARDAAGNVSSPDRLSFRLLRAKRRGR